MPAFDRNWLALVLTGQVFVGAILGIAAQFVLAIGVVFCVLGVAASFTGTFENRSAGILRMPWSAGGSVFHFAGAANAF